MRWCQSCILPDTRPNLTVGPDGICSACNAFRQRRYIGWKQREREFEEVAAHAKSRQKEYDCIVPVSGGKDSTWQVVKCLEYGLRPLAVSWRPPARTEVGGRNLENLIDIGVDHVDFSINPLIEAAFMRKTFEHAGSSGIPMHFAIFAIPTKVAVKFDIPLIVWGENSAVEYGGGEEDRNLMVMNEAWLRKFGVSQGTSPLDWCDETLNQEALAPYRRPETSMLEENDIRAVFLGHYFPWDPETTFEVARKHGFVASALGPKTGYYDYADIDDDFISIHHWLKWYKFGFTRLFDNLALEIRNGRMDRTCALEVFREVGIKRPTDDIRAFCQFTGLNLEAFDHVCERFRNLEIWRQTNDTWEIDEFVLPDWDWS